MTQTVVGEARATTRRVGRTFALACRLLPRAVRDDVYLLYLVFRTLDDLVDFGAADAEERIAAVEAWAAARWRGDAGGRACSARSRARHRAARARPCSSSAAACARTWRRVPILTEADLDRYCYRVAGTVGVLMTALLGTRRAGAPAAAALGMAMQRTNILRDIDEDARERARVRRAPRRSSASACRCPARRERAAARSDRARRRAATSEGWPASRELRHGRRAVAAAAAMYREILRQIEREGYGALAGPGRGAAPAQAARRGARPRCRSARGREARSRALLAGLVAAQVAYGRRPRAPARRRDAGDRRADARASCAAEAIEARGPAAAGAARRRRRGSPASRRSWWASPPAGRSATTRTRSGSGRAPAASRCWPPRRGR